MHGAGEDASVVRSTARVWIRYLVILLGEVVLAFLCMRKVMSMKLAGEKKFARCSGHFGKRLEDGSVCAA
jgi:hypothetical protein